jgi:hypothetical protein
MENRLCLINAFRVGIVRVRWKAEKDDFTLIFVVFVVFGSDHQKTSTPTQALLPSFMSELEREAPFANYLAW